MKNKPIILVVDDQPQNNDLLEAHLVLDGYEVVKAENGEEALEKLSNNQIELVLLDIMMPGMSGFEVLEKLRADKKTRLVPVVMITTLKETEDRVKALEAGCDDFISKPFDKHELLVKIRSLLRIKSLHDEVNESREYAENIINTVREPLIVLDQDLRVVTASRSFYEVFNVNPKETVGQLIYDLGDKQWDIPKLRELLETILPYESSFDNYEVEHDFAAIGRRIMLLNARQIQRVSGKERIILLAIEDITERKRSEKYLLEEERLKTQKLEAIGILAGGIAHDFNNLLQGVFGYISMAKMNIDQKQKSLDMMEQAEKALQMSVNLTSQLLTFSKGGKPATKRIALRPVIENSVKFALSGSRIDYRIQIDEGLRMVEADGGQLGQVIQNLVLNAEQAMPMHGTITVTAKNVGSPQKGLLPVLQQGNYVEISIKDNGTGIPEKCLPKIFDLYFTTKDKGSGLGLATSYSIVKNHGGLIDVKSKLGEGTTFFVYLPAVEALETLPVTVSKDVRALRKGRILLMDDDDIVRNIAGIMVRSLDHEVELAEDGEAAIARYRESMKTGRRFDIVIMDLTIRGGMGGEEAIKELLQVDPDIKAIVSSGYTDTSAISEYKTIGFKACLTKPYDLYSLNGTLNSLLN